MKTDVHSKRSGMKATDCNEVLLRTGSWDSYNSCMISHMLPHSSQSTAAINPYPTAFPYGNGMVLHFYQQQESSTTKTVHKVINKGLKTYV